MTADHAGQTGGEREVCDNGLAHYFDHGGVCIHCGHDPSRAMQFDGNVATAEWIYASLASRPVPPAGQAAREAAVEAVTRDELAESIRDELAQWPIGSGYYSTTVSTADATEMVDVILPLIDAYVAALSAAPGQEPLVEWCCPNCGATTRARMADHPGQEQGR